MKAQTECGCVICNEVITNPICPDCLAERMQDWLMQTNPKLAKDIRGYRLDGKTKCLFCGKGMSICAHCFSMDIYEYLSDNSLELATEFAARFDFELRKELV
ncbi:hypothetical protein KY306_01085 [Candidatus Woesearchaeota archaeon]|nr:hypothetical protein [Candidatus Woesearchaeota archaeon]